MIDVGFDFTGRHVLVTGGTRGLGLAMAQAFRTAGARVSVTGTKILPSLYDADLSGFDYHQLQLSSADAIESFVEKIGSVDVLVNAAGARLSSSMDEHEREFLCHSARLGFVGPQRLTQQLRHRICASTAPGGGAVVHTSPTLAWLELTQTSADAENELRAQTAQAGRAWSRIGARVNTVLTPHRVAVPSQQRLVASVVTVDSGTVLTRPRTTPEVNADEVATIAMFLASTGAAALSGQTIHATVRR
ncbi:SDR family NAD(P)-dependent oxidoreductase [Nocardioides daphniae]|uniref:3-hydroxybutyrate dehydrogenase n=1 Tax=Nocardioides daphniae TaxID=402297 RepID=A0A4P7UFY5_9ACTN|nr:SDR family oxidoreductase [Nocardioides daphniae]QCC77689.1 SDR family oxidoreductase [Nocardioides daphniae]GGD29433.1 3-hydroxybutyrate dehydrogenase [Nocardioides daphniae]